METKVHRHVIHLPVVKLWIPREVSMVHSKHVLRLL